MEGLRTAGRIGSPGAGVRFSVDCVQAAGSTKLLFILRVDLSVSLRLLAKWFHTTRLETRTKESNMHASVRVIETRTRSQSDSDGIRPPFIAGGGAPSAGSGYFTLKDLSKSMYVGTRKMVNYA